MDVTLTQLLIGIGVVLVLLAIWVFLIALSPGRLKDWDTQASEGDEPVQLPSHDAKIYKFPPRE